MKKNSCTPIDPKKYPCYGLKKIHTRNMITKKISCCSKIPLLPPPPPHNFSNGPSLNQHPVKKRQSAGRFLAGTYESCYAFSPFKNCGILIFGWIFDRKVRGEACIFRPFCCEVWKRSDAIFWGEIALALEPFQNKDPSLVLLLL